jgi:hypothetical protein
MSDILNLNCWNLDDDPHLAFTIEVAKSETVHDLKKAIQDETKSAAPAYTLHLWKVSK